MTQRAVVFTGLIRDEAKFIHFLDFYQCQPASSRPPLYFSTWQGELAKYPAVQDALAHLGAHILEQPQPDLILPGHVLHQIAALDFPLAIIPDDVFVYKGRPDFSDIDTYRAFMALEPQECAALPFLHPAPMRRIYILGHFPAHPFYINDMIYCGLAADLKKNTELSFTTLLRYNRVAPEQLMWGHWGFGSDWIDRYMRCNIGLIFDDAEKTRVHLELLQSSACYQHALALYMLIIDAWFSDLQPQAIDVPKQLAQCTLEELLWAPIDNKHVSHHSNAMNNALSSTQFAKGILAGQYRRSTFGDLFQAALSDILRQPLASPERLAWIEKSALDFQIKMNSVLPGVGGKCLQNNGPLWQLDGPKAQWTQQQTGTPLTKALEDEINLLRRANNLLQTQLNTNRP